MFLTVKTAVLTTPELTDRVRLVFAALKTSIAPGIGIKAIRRACSLVYVEAMHFFASQAWTGTHQCQNLSALLGLEYSILHVHNAVITTSDIVGHTLHKCDMTCVR